MVIDTRTYLDWNIDTQFTSKNGCDFVCIKKAKNRVFLHSLFTLRRLTVRRMSNFCYCVFGFITHNMRISIEKKIVED